MRLTEWAAAPLAAPPPIPINTDGFSASNLAYRIGAIPPEALADDLASAGLTYSPGRGHGYRRNGEHLDSYFVGDVIAAIFMSAGRTLDRYLANDPDMRSIARDRASVSSIPYSARYDERAAEYLRLSRRIEDSERDLPLTLEQIELVAQSLRATGRLIRNYPTSRTEAVRRFRSVIPKPPHTRATSANVDEFLATIPAGPISRPDLHASALAAGLTVGSRTLYAAADALGWPSASRRGVRRYRVPETP